MTAPASRTSTQPPLARGTVAWTELGRAASGALAIYLGGIAATRLTGLRSFSEMSSFDFAMAVAIGW